MHNAERHLPWTCAILKFMSDSEIEATQNATPTQAPSRKMSPAELAVVSAREKLSRYLPRAVEILTELAETGENERVRLSAAESILDRAGVGKSSTQEVVQHSQAEHEAANRSAQDIVAMLAKNKQGVADMPAPRDLEVLVVHEGE